MVESLIIKKPDDFHLHVRCADMLQLTIPATASVFSRAIIMPNLVPPVTTIAKALEYKKEIEQYIPKKFSSFQPLMTLYLTDNTPPTVGLEIAKNKDVFAAKLYPAGATTNSDDGVTDINKIDDVLAEFANHNVPLLIHGEVTASNIDIFARERVFIEKILIPLTKRHPKLRVVLEHITTKDAVEFVIQSSDNIAATITPQHLLYDRNDMLVGGIKPHLYCLPILKRSEHQKALIKAAISGNPKFFLGTDSAPHTQNKKESCCGCAGCFSAPIALQLYAKVFDEEHALDKLEAFCSFYGADFYGLPRNKEEIVLLKKDFIVPKAYTFNNQQIIPLEAGNKISWSIADT